MLPGDQQRELEGETWRGEAGRKRWRERAGEAGRAKESGGERVPDPAGRRGRGENEVPQLGGGWSASLPPVGFSLMLTACYLLSI